MNVAVVHGCVCGGDGGNCRKNGCAPTVKLSPIKTKMKHFVAVNPFTARPTLRRLNDQLKNWQKWTDERSRNCHIRIRSCHKWLGNCHKRTNEWIRNCHMDTSERLRNCYKWADERLRNCYKWTDEWLRNCHKWTDERLRNCHKWTDERLRNCHKWTDKRLRNCHRCMVSIFAFILLLLLSSTDEIQWTTNKLLLILKDCRVNSKCRQSSGPVELHGKAVNFNNMKQIFVKICSVFNYETILQSSICKLICVQPYLLQY